MKKIILFIALLSTAFAGKGQNLVPNGDFEQYTGCSTGSSNFDSCLFWINPSTGGSNGGSPDYYHQCNSSSVGMPDNWGGYQNAHSGLAYSGIYVWVQNPTNIREYMEAPLTSALIANQCYHFEMYASLADKCQYTTDDLQVYFTDIAITGITNYYPLPVTPQLNNTAGNSPDTTNWTLISGNYIAQGGENFLIIGNFKNDVNTTYTLINPSAPYVFAYIYIDDVCLTPCGSSCSITAIEEQNIPNSENLEYLIYPNPVKDELTVSSKQFGEKAEIKIYDVMGKEILRKQFNPDSYRDQSSILNLQSLQSGIYFLEINTGKEIFRKKFLKE